MISLKELEPYITNVDPGDYSQAKSAISNIGFNNWFESELAHFINCTRTFSDGTRCTQTNDKRYSNELSLVIYMTKEFIDNDIELQDSYLNRVLIQHRENLKFEEEHGFRYVPNQKKQTKPKTSRKPKQTDMFKESTASSKLKAHGLTLGKLKLKIDTVS